MWLSTQHRVTDRVSFLFLIWESRTSRRELGSLTAALQLPECSANRRSLPGMRPRPSSGWFFGGAAGSPWQDWVLFFGCLLQGFLRPGSSVLETRSGAMSRLGSVQRKMPCVFVTEVKAEPSAKREHQVPGGLGCWAASPTLRGGPGALQVLQGRFG